jgi:hypothetical protein
MTLRMLALAALAILALPSCAGRKPTSAASPQAAVTASAAPSMPNCNGEAPVWTIPRVKVYLVPGDALYGKTKNGEFICRSQAHAEGYRPGRGPILKGVRNH